MTETLIGVGYELLTHAGHATIDHVAARLKPPTPPAFAPPAWTPPTWTPPAALGAAAGGAVAEVDSTLSTTRYGSYSSQVAQGVACLACTRSHLATAAQAAQAAQAAAARGDTTAARAQLAAAAAELDVMIAYDWSADKLAATPAADRAIVEALRPCVESARASLGTPQSLAMAAGSLAEAQRFAASTAPTDRDRAEIAPRREVADGVAGHAERVEFAEELTVTRALRAGRHVLDAADPFDPAALGQAAAHWHQAAAAATPVPSAAGAADAADQCASCKAEFYQRYFALMADRRN